MARHGNHIAFFIHLEILCTKCNALIDRAMVANDTGLAYHDTRSVVDGKILANLRTRMDVNAGDGVGTLSDNTRNDGHLHIAQNMCHAVVNHRLNGGIAINHLIAIIHSRVIGYGCLYIGKQETFQFR